MLIEFSALDLAKLLDSELVGKNIIVNSCCPISDCREFSATFIKDSSFLKYLKNAPAQILVISHYLLKEKCSQMPQSFIFSNYPRISFGIVASKFVDKKNTKGIHPSAIVDTEANIDSSACIGPYVVIEKNTCIGENVTIGSFSKVYEGTKIGKNCIIHSNCTLGSEGYAFERVEEKWVKVYQSGGVVIEDDVEIFDHANIDRAMIGNTFIGRGSKIDRHCHLAHGSKIGSNCAIVANVVIAGSAIVGDRSWVGPNSVLINQGKIGNDVIIGMGSVVIKEVPSGEVWVGNPAKFLRDNLC